jgi:homogentisate 1,2-dioxygenase
MWRIEAAGDVDLLLIESTDSPYRLPESSMLGRHLPFDAAVLDVPALDDAFRAQQRRGRTPVRVKHGGRISTLVYPFNPLDAEGWKGDLYPIRLNVRDIRPISSHRAHVVASGHTTFLSDRFRVCTSVPYPSPRDPTALKLPPFRDDVEVDEVRFVHDGSPTALNAGLEPGLMSFDPRGVTHGPVPGALPIVHGKPGASMANELVILQVGTRDPLQLGKDAAKVAVAGSEMLHASAIELAPDAVEAANTGIETQTVAA